MVSTGEIVARRFGRRGGPSGLHSATPLVQKTSLGADSGASLDYRRPPERMRSGGPLPGFLVHAKPPGLDAGGDLNGELGFYSGEGA